MLYFAEFPYPESSFYDLKCFSPESGKVLTVDKNCFYKFNPFEGGVLCAVKTQRGKALRGYYCQKRKVESNIEDFSRGLAQFYPLPITSEKYFLAVEPVVGPGKTKEKHETILYIVNLDCYR